MLQDFKFIDTKRITKINPIGTKSFSFIEIAAPNENHQVFLTLTLQRLGFVYVGKHKRNDIRLYQQGAIRLLINCDTVGRGAGQEGSFIREHGLCASALGIWVDEPKKACANALERGAIPYKYATPYGAPVINGVGDTLIYFVGGPSLDAFFREEFIFLI